ncbi:MAG: FAD-binding protein [Elusimicrobia bacterium]|nr:FAD-binding protein [Elusimicrobiota bacterium]
MPYPQEMQKSTQKIVSTRSQRIKQTFQRLSPEEKEKLLRGFHPDYKPGTQRKLKLGPNKNDFTPYEIADMIESYSRLSPDEFNKIDLSKPDFQVDVLVIGGGGAGASAALVVQENGANVLLATKLRIGDTNTMMAQGGIQAADKPNDSPVLHYLDVMGGGGYKNVPELVGALVMDAPSIMQYLENLGIMFDKQPDGTFVTIHGGGTCRKRMHAARDYTGAEIMRVLRDEIKNYRIPVLEFSPAVELLTDEKGICTGAVLFNLETEKYLVVRAKTVIMATGGSGRLHIQGFPTSNHYGATADGLVLAYRAGAKLAFLDTIQYHPTGVAYPEQIVGLLITEKVRGLGAHLVNSDGERFIFELETRDTVASAIIRECQDRKKGITTPTGMQGVWLDTPLIDILRGEGTIKFRLPAMYRQFIRFGIDMTKEPVLTYPTQHYQNGGVLINERCETNVENLYVAGEVSGGVHGRNRLMGNSLLDILVFGRRAGVASSAKSKKIKFGKLGLTHIKKFHRALKTLKIDPKKIAPILLPDYRQNKSIG